ncbi:MAG TPA: hypothetical protein VH593_06105 [Ktedonobacteraceae bacterium]
MSKTTQQPWLMSRKENPHRCLTCGLRLPNRSHHTHCSTCRKVTIGITESSWSAIWQAWSETKRRERMRALEGQTA